MKLHSRFAIALLFALFFLPVHAGAGEAKVMLMYESKYCREYPKEVTDALMAVKGVSEVDLKTLPGHAIVTTDGTVKEEALVDAVNGVKGMKDGIKWACKVEVMKESGE